MSHLIKQLAVSILSAACLLFSLSAQADFRKALDALKREDSQTMLTEVKKAVVNKNDDGIVLFLSMFEWHFKVWQSQLNTSQKKALFKYLEQAAWNSSLQSQYRLAMIARGATQSYHPYSEEAVTAERQLIERLTPIANKGYAPASMEIYQKYARPLEGPDKTVTINKKQVMKWLIKAAESGSVQAAFELGMKQLNIRDGSYGCGLTNEKISVCLKKDVAKGWHWMQIAAKRANAYNVNLGELAYQMGLLYEKGVNGEQPDIEQAYLWYLLSANSAYPNRNSSNKIIQLKLSGVLEEIAPKLHSAHGHPSQWKHLLHPSVLPQLPSLYSIEVQRKGNKPVFTMLFPKYLGRPIVDVYSSGQVNVAYQRTLGEERNEVAWRIKPQKVQDFLKELEKINFHSWPVFVEESPDCRWGQPQACIFTEEVLLVSTINPTRTIVIKTQKDIAIEGNQGSNKLLGIVEEYFSIRNKWGRSQLI